MDYKLYLDFVLANMYKTTNEALQYHFRMLDLHKTGRLTVFEVCLGHPISRPDLQHRSPAPISSPNPPLSRSTISSVRSSRGCTR